MNEMVQYETGDEGRLRPPSSAAVSVLSCHPSRGADVGKTDAGAFSKATLDKHPAS